MDRRAMLPTCNNAIFFYQIDRFYDRDVSVLARHSISSIDEELLCEFFHSRASRFVVVSSANEKKKHKNIFHRVRCNKKKKKKENRLQQQT